METTSTVALVDEGNLERRDIRILVVADERLMADSLKQNLTREGYSVDTVSTGAAAIETFDRQPYQLVVCDLQLSDLDGLTVMRHMHDAQPATEVIALTGYGSIQKAVSATKAGAFYFVEKPFDFEELRLLVERALERRQLIGETARLQQQFSIRAAYFELIGASRQMQTIYETIESIAKSDASVLIVGESGTGKELIANAIHYNSLRSNKAFIKVNCAALPKELIESELFGHTKDAVAGAHADKEGFVQHAAGGSLLLDEIADLPTDLQPKLLQALQEGHYHKIGSEKPYAVDFRLICSTNRMPADAIRDGLLREDLFYRISTITIHVPPLRERNEDVQLLTEHFVRLYAQKYERQVSGVSPDAYQRLFNHAWPGNVRELQNVIERAVLLAKGSRIEPVDLPFDNSADEAPATAWEVPTNMTLDEIEKVVIARALQRTGGNKQAAASLLGIYRPRLYSKIRKYKINVRELTENS
jgi:DNA-binding NtrC family response regulator